jgi:hypothetical protein
MLGCMKPISSPIMNRMFGFFSWAAAGAADPTAVKPTANAAATALPASRAVPFRTFRLFIFILSCAVTKNPVALVKA